MIRGTRNLLGDEADRLASTIYRLEAWAQKNCLVRFTPSSLAPAEIFDSQIGDNRAYSFTDEGGRRLVLLPEVTAVVLSTR